jgi:hypothetical protein
MYDEVCFLGGTYIVSVTGVFCVLVCTLVVVGCLVCYVGWLVFCI